MAAEIQTWGYEGLNIADFVARLRRAGATTVIDVRANPISRKPGFSKKALAVHLGNAGIDYVHAPKMGCPKPVRDRYKADGDWATYTLGFMKYIGGQGDAVSEVAAVAQRSKSCLICFEADFNFCHRTFVARAVSALTGMEIVHLTERTSIADPMARSAA